MHQSAYHFWFLFDRSCVKKVLIGVFVVFFSLSDIWVWYYKLGHDRFIPCPFYLTVLSFHVK